MSMSFGRTVADANDVEFHCCDLRHVSHVSLMIRDTAQQPRRTRRYVLSMQTSGLCSRMCSPSIQDLQRHDYQR